MSGTTPDQPPPLRIVAHRGASAEAPEHTIAALELALAQGADGLALDVHLSRDHHPVVIHDFTLERTTDGAGPVATYSMRELKRLDAGSWRGRRFAGQRIQTLEEIFERFRGRCRFWITVRGGEDLYPGIEERVISAIEIYDLLDGCLVQSVAQSSLERLRLMNAQITLGIVLTRAPLDPAVMAGAGVTAVTADARLFTRNTTATIRRATMDCYARIHDEPALADRLAAWGVSGIVTSQPGSVRARLASTV